MCDVIIIGGDLVHHVIFQAPAKPGKGVLVLPTYDGNLLAVPTAEDSDDREDVSATYSGIQKIDMLVKKSVSSLDIRKTIRTFTGVRVRPDTGRCQGCFCTPRVLEILSRKLKLPIEHIAKSDSGTEIVLGRLK